MNGAKRTAFQEATVSAALQRLLDPRGSRRFLVADEVGLGKTLVARGVMEGVVDKLQRKKIPRIFYVCSSLNIAHQNTNRLLEGLSEDELDAARIHVDRLGLVPAQDPPGAAPFHLYTLTPDTSLRVQGTGVWHERMLLGRALQEICELPEDLLHDALHVGMRIDTWKNHWNNYSLPEQALPYLKAFRRYVCFALGQKEGAWGTTLANEIQRRFQDEKQRGSTVSRLRRAMTLAVLDVVSPDLIIFDEFQRFFDILIQQPSENTEAEDEDEHSAEHRAEAEHIMRVLLEPRDDAENGAKKRPAILMLSATPYRLYSRYRDGGQHHSEFFELLKFLFADDAPENLGALEQDFKAYKESLVRDVPGSSGAFEVKTNIEERLRLVMARTERAALAPALGEAKSRKKHEETVQADDFRVFRHFVESLRKEDRFSATEYWSSIPYPLQMMRKDYVASQNAEPTPCSPDDAFIAQRAVSNYRHKGLAHPKLRALVNLLKKELTLPWLPPTRPWWPLGEPFNDAAGASKALIFSRFRAVPRAVATLLGYEAERLVFRNRRYAYFKDRSDKKVGRRSRRKARPREKFRFGNSSGYNRNLLLLFLPLAQLAEIGDPLQLKVMAKGRINLKRAKDEVRAKLVQHLGEDTKRTSRNPLAWALQLEKEIDPELSALQNMLGGIKANDDSALRKSIRRALATTVDVEHPSPKELDELAEFALTAPGMVLLRATGRVFRQYLNTEELVAKAFKVAMGGLRHYLDRAEWHLAWKQFRQKPSHISAVCGAVWHGNLEAVLDEYFVVSQGLANNAGDLTGALTALDELDAVLKMGDVTLEVRKLEKDDESMRLRCHAALAFGLRARTADDEHAVRDDHVRNAFNSPFRPMALVTTSIGQEGLDFHRYCRHIVHWDLPHNPVDLEQREGRVDRHGGLAVRHALRMRVTTENPSESPWRVLASILAEEEHAGGLCPWWHTDSAEIVKTVLMPRFSEQADHLEALEKDLALYRYALGQPDQEVLVRALARRIDGEKESGRKKLKTWLKEVAIDLCPYLEGR